MCRDENIPNIKNKFKYIKHLAKMKTCPKFIKEVVEDYDAIKEELNQLYESFESAQIQCKYDRIKRIKRNISCKKNMLKCAKDNIHNSHIFVVPIMKTIYTENTMNKA
jgi:hypothetical protein